MARSRRSPATRMYWPLAVCCTTGAWSREFSIIESLSSSRLAFGISLLCLGGTIKRCLLILCIGGSLGTHGKNGSYPILRIDTDHYAFFVVDDVLVLEAGFVDLHVPAVGVHGAGELGLGLTWHDRGQDPEENTNAFFEWVHWWFSKKSPPSKGGAGSWCSAG